MQAPPGATPPAPPVPPTLNYRDPHERLRAARIGVQVGMLMYAFSAISDLYLIVTVRSVRDEFPQAWTAPYDALPVTDDAIDRINQAGILSGVGGALGFLGIIVGAIFVIRWQNVAIRNQVPLGLLTPRHTPATAGLSWFIPIWALFGPKQAINDIWRSGDLAYPASQTKEQWVKREVPAWLAVYWTLWLLAQFVENAAGRALFTDGTLRADQYSSILFMVGAALTIASGAVFVRFLVRASERQHARATQLDLARPSVSTPS